MSELEQVPTVREERCDACIYFQSGNERGGTCHRGLIGTADGDWPVRAIAEWCGEFVSLEAAAEEKSKAIVLTPESSWEDFKKTIGGRACSALYRLQVESFEDLCAKSEGDLLLAKRFGDHSLQKIKASLVQCGRKLRE